MRFEDPKGPLRGWPGDARNTSNLDGLAIRNANQGNSPQTRDLRFLVPGGAIRKKKGVSMGSLKGF